MGERIKLGTVLPIKDFGCGPDIVAAFAQAAEALGYDHITGTDHVVGVNVASRPDWDPSRNTSDDIFHDPFVLFGFLAGLTKTIEFSTQVLILAQRQTVLVAKQAANVDVLSNGRLRLGVGIGWNEAEFIALNENFRDRGKRSEEQVEVMQKLWAEKHVTFKGKWHDIPDVGINPLPIRKSIPIWFGGHVDATLQRIVKYGEGWSMLAYPPGDDAIKAIEKLHGVAKAAGRDPSTIGIEIWTSIANGGPDDWRDEVRFWKDAGITHITVNNTRARGHHKRMEGRTFSDHVAGIERFREAVKDVL